MTDQQKAALADRLAGASRASTVPASGDLSAALERMVGAGAARFGLRAVLGGTLATFMTATIAGVLTSLGA